MRKMVFGKKLSRGKKSREALFRSLVRDMVLEGGVVTTLAKAKASKGQIEKMVTLAKKGTLAARRQALAYLANDRQVCDALFDGAGRSFSQRKGGYTRLILLPCRKGDSAKMARIEWVEEVKLEGKTKEVKKAEKTVKEEKTATKKKVVKKAVKKEVKRK